MFILLKPMLLQSLCLFVCFFFFFFFFFLKSKVVIEFSNAIRDWKWNSTYILRYKPFHKNVSTMPSITVYMNESGIVKDEWNTDEIIDEHFLNNKKFYD